MNYQQVHAEEGIMEDMVTATLEAAKELWFCTTKDQVMKLFEKHCISKPESKITLLRQTRQVVESFHAPTDQSLTPEQEYEDELLAFVEGSWRLLAI